MKAENFDEEIYFKIENVREKTEKENFCTKKTLEVAQAMIDFLKNFLNFKSIAEWSRTKTCRLY